MLTNYLKLAFRNLIKNKSHTLINVGGLTLGIVCAIVIFLVIQFDLSFDTWHQDRDRIYRVVTEDSDYGTISHTPGGPYPRAEAIRNDINGIEYVALVNNNFATPVVSLPQNSATQNKFKEEELAFVEPQYFKIFNYQWVAGNPENALNQPNSAVLSQSFAQKLFNSQDVVGKSFVVFIEDFVDVQVTGIIQDPPKNSDFPFEVFVAHNSKSRGGFTFADQYTEWSSSSSTLQNYVKLKPGVTPEQINVQFDPLITKYRNEEMAAEKDYFLQPLSEIHFDSRFGNYSGRVIAKKTLFALGIIGFLLLLTACINFVNLNTAIAVRRSKEVGLRKTLGGTKTQLTLHFLGETAFITFISLLLALGVTEIVLRGVEPLLGFSPELSLFANYQLILFLGILFVGITLAAGWYPTQHLSNFSPIEAIRNKINASYGEGLVLRRSLIVVQFTITQILIIGTIIIANQIKLFQTQDLGFNKEAVVEIDIPFHDKQVLDTFKNNLLSESSIQNVSFSNTGTTSNSTWSGNYLVMEDTVRLENNAEIKYVDHDFIDTYGLTIVAGKVLAPSDTVREFLVNEAFARQVGYGDNYQGLIGKSNFIWGNEAPIVGIVKDFNTQSLHSELPPTVISANRSFSMGAIKITPGRTQDALIALEESYKQAFPDFVFEYKFLDDNIAEMYETEQQTARIMNAFTIIAILIGSLGLFGLVSYMAATRTKEIGVRKVLGASIMDILKIFGTELALLTGISFIFAVPVSWYLMQKWLADFAYRIEIGVEIFALALAGTVLVAVLTIGYKSISAALTNPIDSLKSE